MKSVVKLNIVVLLVVAAVFFTMQSVVAQVKPELKKISASVYSYENVAAGSPGNVFSANAGIIVGQAGVLVVDTLTSAAEAEQFFADIKKVTEKTVRYVVNTHYHLDHSLGNSFFADKGATVISHKKCRDAIVAGGEKTLENPSVFGLPADFWKGTRVAIPDFAFEREMTVDLGNLTVKLIHSGAASHSAGSIIVHVPEENVLFTGDILFTNFHPYLAEGDFIGWKTTLDMISSMNVTHIIPGHGPLSSNKDIEDMKTYLTVFDDKAKELSVGEKDVEKLTSKMLEVLPKRANGDFIVPMNLKARYLSDTGKEQGKY